MGGYKKPISFSADERKLKLFPFLPEIIKQSEVIEEDTDERGRRNMKAYRVVASTVTLKGEKLRVRVSLREDDNGNLYYDHVIAQKKSQGKRSNPATNPGEISQGVNNSITLPELVVNLFFDGE